MSCCLIIQTKEHLFLGSDSSISAEIDDKLYRLSDLDGKKLYVIDNNIGVFCSGNLHLSYCIMSEFIKSEIHTPNSLRCIAENQCIKKKCYELDILFCTYENNSTTIYQISPYHDFNIIVRQVEENETAIWTAGVKTKECYKEAYENIQKNIDIRDVYKNTFNNITYEAIGGILSIYMINNNGIIPLLYEKIEEKKDLKRLENNVFDNMSLIVSENLVGQIILGTKVYIADTTGRLEIIGNSIILKDNTDMEKVKIGNYNNTWSIHIYNDNGELSMDGNNLYCNNINVKNFKADYISGGTLDANNVTITNLKVTSANIENLSADTISEGTLRNIAVSMNSNQGTVNLTSSGGLTNTYNNVTNQYKSVVAIGSGYATYNTPLTVTLPDSFKGKQFWAIVSLSAVNSQVISQQGASLISLSIYTNPNSFNYTNGTFVVTGVNGNSQDTAIFFSYVAVA